MPFKKGISGNPAGRPKKGKKVMGLLERALPRIEKEIDTATPEEARQIVIGLVDLFKHQQSKKTI